MSGTGSEFVDDWANQSLPRRRTRPVGAAALHARDILDGTAALLSEIDMVLGEIGDQSSATLPSEAFSKLGNRVVRFVEPPEAMKEGEQ